MRSIILILFILLKFNNAYADPLKIEIANEAFNNNNYDEVIFQLSDLDLKNNSDALFILAYSFQELKNYNDSLKNYLKCAELGDGYCQNNVGHMYDNGIGTKINYKEAFYWFEKAKFDIDAKPYALTSLANMFLEGNYVNQSYIKAFENYEEAAETGFNRAMYALGIMYEKGEGTPYNYDKAKEYYLKAHKNGHELALDRKEALEGDADRALKLATIYTTGKYNKYNNDTDYLNIGIPIQKNEGLFWYKITEFLNQGSMNEKDWENFGTLLNETPKYLYNKAFKNFEIWKKFSGFEYDTETLDDESKYYLAHSGTGFFINSEYLLTNKHVAHIDDDYTIKCDRVFGYDPYKGTFESYENIETKYLDNYGDVEILKSPKKSENFETIISNKNISMGDEIAIIGFPQGRAMSKYPKITSGIVSSEYGSNESPSEFMTDATSYGGSSGSPVYSTDGTLIGILYAGPQLILRDFEGRITGATADPNIAYVFKSSYLEKFLDLNNVTYKINPNENFWAKILRYFGFYNEKIISLSEISEKEKNKVRLLTCYQLSERYK